MVSGFISRLVILVFGTLYPAYASYKAVRTKNVKEYVKWMMYWIVFALFTCAETFTDLFLSFWFPFYYEIKIITVIYLLSPATKGSSILYRKFVHPVLTKREQEIDEYIAKAKEQGYHTMLNLGSKGVNYATSLIMQTAIKGGGGLVNQLRKSYSLSDLSEEQNGSLTDGGGHRLVRRNQTQPSGQILPENSQGFYSPEADLYQQPVDANGEVLFSDDIGPGYSNGVPLYYNMGRSKGDVLVRTASLGPSSRTRARAVTKNGLPKRASISEDGSTQSALEPRESQTETDTFNFPISHLATYPFSLTSFQPYFIPQYQHRNAVENQVFAFINHSQYSRVLNDRAFAFQNAFGGVFERQTDGNSEDQSVYIVEENSKNSSEIKSKDVASDTAGEVQTLNDDDSSVNPTSDKDKEILAETKNLEEKETTKENLCPSLSDSTNEKQQPFKKRTGKYNKKLAPTPPVEQSIPKSASSLTVEDEESEFYTPNASPKSLRKQSPSHLDILPDKSNLDIESTSKTQANTIAEVPKKVKTKKGNFNVSKKLNMPKMSFSFWHQKGAKQTSDSDSCSVVSIESASTKSETQSQTELFIPLRDYSEGSEEDSNLKEDPHKIKTGINQ